MTATYDLSTDNGKVRLLIGDKDITDTVFSDEELAVFIANQPSIYSAAAEAMEAWAATYAANANSEQIGDYRYTQKTVDDMLKLAATLRAKESSMPVTGWASMDLTDIGKAI